MSVVNLLASMELISSSSVLSKATPEGTLEIQMEQASSPGSLSSPHNIQEYSFVSKDIPLTTICKCGYRRPFCACVYYNFPN